jgi:hypothetical protein
MFGGSAFVWVLFLSGALLFFIYLKIGSILRCIFFTATTGALAMGVLWVLSNFLPIGVALTPFSLITSLILGIPGVVGMLLMALI